MSQRWSESCADYVVGHHRRVDWGAEVDEASGLLPGSLNPSMLGGVHTTIQWLRQD